MDSPVICQHCFRAGDNQSSGWHCRGWGNVPPYRCDCDCTKTKKAKALRDLYRYTAKPPEHSD